MLDYQPVPDSGNQRLQFRSVGDQQFFRVFLALLPDETSERAVFAANGGGFVQHYAAFLFGMPEGDRFAIFCAASSTRSCGPWNWSSWAKAACDCRAGLIFD